MDEQHWDEGQAAVLGAGEGALLVLGAAGTGKTELLIELMAARLRHGQPPALALVATRQAGSQVRDRVIRSAGRTSVQPSVMTVHALCLSVLKRWGDLTGGAPRVLTAPEQEFRIRELLAGRGPEAWPAPLAEAVTTRSFARQVGGALARTRQLGLDPGDLIAFGDEAGDPIWAGLGVFMAEYLDVLDAEGVLDYAELVHRVRLLVGEPEVAAMLHREFSAVYVDEVAELDPAQLALVRALVPSDGRCVGFADPDTAIFGFRGAHPRSVAEFIRLFDSEVTVLRANHRVPAALATATRRLAGRLPSPAGITDVVQDYRHPDITSEGPGRLEVLTFPDEAAQARRIADELRSAHLTDGLAWAEMTVLVRSGRRQILPLVRALAGAGIPVEVAGDEIGLAEELAVRPLLLALDVVARGEACDPDEAHRLLMSGWGGLDAVALRSLGRGLRAGAQASGPALSSADLIAAALGGPDPVPAEAGEHAAAVEVRRLALTRARAALLAGARPEEVLWLLWTATPWPDELRNEALAQTESAARADRDLDAVCALFELARSLPEVTGERGVRALLAEVAAQQIPADTEREAAVHGRGVRVMTAHRSKGQQWPLVVVAGVQEGVWPDVRRRASLADPHRLTSAGLAGGLLTRELVAAERRLFLLAVTRASDRLLVTAVAGTEGEADQPSRFLDELGVSARYEQTSPVRLVTLRALVSSLRATCVDPAVSAHLREAAVVRLARLAEQTDARGRPLVPDADPERWWGLREPTSVAAARPAERLVITPSQLASVLSCPRQFFLSKEAKADPPRSSSAILGTVIHALAERGVDALTLPEAMAHLDRVWDQIPFAARWFSASERAAAEQAIVRFLGWRDARAGVEVVGVEVPFRAEIEVDGVSVTIAGTVDRLEREPSGALRVIDFKSSRSLPTKAEAAASDQLGLYQLAVEAGGFGIDAPSAGAELVFLRHGEEEYPKVLGQESVRARPHLSDDPEELGYPTWVHQRVAAARRILAEGRFDAVPGGQCRWCAFASSCPISAQVIA